MGLHRLGIISCRYFISLSSFSWTQYPVGIIISFYPNCAMQLITEFLLFPDAMYDRQQEPGTRILRAINPTKDIYDDDFPPPIPKPAICLSLVGLVTLGLLIPCPTTLAALLAAALPPPPPSCASRSRKSDHSSASDSLLLPLPPPPAPSGMKSEDNEGVLGVRRKGESGTRRAAFEAPGRARPARSRCSGGATVSILPLSCNAIACLFVQSCHGKEGRITFRPAEQGGNELQHLKLLGIAPVEHEELQEVIRHNLPVDIVLWLAALQEA